MFFAGATRARIVAADFWRGADELGNGCVVVMAVVAIWPMHVAWGAMIVIMVMIAIGAMNMWGDGFDSVGHGSA